MRFSTPPGSGLANIGLTILALFGLLAATAASAQSYTWTGAVSSDWNTPGNWSPNSVPSGQYATVTFGPATRTSVTISTQGNSAGALTFTANAPAYTISISGAQDVYPSIELYGGLSNQSTTTRPTFVTAAQGGLTLGQGVFDKFSINNSGAAGLLKAGDNVTVSNSSIVNQSGGRVGFVIGSAPSADSSSVVNNLGGSVDISGDFSSAVATIGSLSGAGNVYLGSQALALGALNRNDTISGVIADGCYYSCNGAGSSGGTLSKIGNGTLLLTGANTYTGQTTVQSGTLQVDGSLTSATVLVDSGAVFAGAGTIGDLLAQANSVIIPGNANANSKLSAGRLLCANSPIVQERIGNIGSSTHGTYLSLAQSLTTGFCPDLYFKFSSAGVPLAAGQSYLLAIIQGSTNYTASNINFDFNSFQGYHQATGTILIGNFGSVSTIYLQLTSTGDEIFASGFEITN